MMYRNRYSPMRRNPLESWMMGGQYQPAGFSPYGYGGQYAYGQYYQPITGFGSRAHEDYYYGGAYGEKPCPPGTAKDENGDCESVYARNPHGGGGGMAHGGGAFHGTPQFSGYNYGYPYYPVSGFNSPAYANYYYGGAFGEKPCPPGTVEDENGDCESVYARNPVGGVGGVGGGVSVGPGPAPSVYGYGYPGYGYPGYGYGYGQPIAGFGSPQYSAYYYGGARPRRRCPPGMTWTEDLGCVDMTPQRSKHPRQRSRRCPPGMTWTEDLGCVEIEGGAYPYRASNPGSCCAACAMQNPDVTCSPCAAAAARAAGNPTSVARKKSPPPRAPKYKYGAKDIKGNCPPAEDCANGWESTPNSDICKCLVSPFVSSSGYASNPSAQARRALTTRRVAERVRRAFESNPSGCGVSQVENPCGPCAAMARR